MLTISVNNYNTFGDTTLRNTQKRQTKTPVDIEFGVHDTFHHNEKIGKPNNLKVNKELVKRK